MHACTIVARNYLAFARVLAESFLRIHPDSSFTTLVVDAEFGFDPSGEPFNVVTPAQLDLSTEEFHRMAVMYDVTELSTALKPWTLRYLIENGADAALYIDPDIQLFSPIDDVAEMVAQHGVALTPHTLHPMPRDNRLPSEADIMGSGVYNLGFIGVGAAAVPFLRWWEERLMRDAISAPEQMLFTDQRWVDFVPSYFDHYIIRDPGFNVAYWNLDARRVTKDGDTFLVNGQPLRFFHFSGYRPETPWILSKYVASSPRVLLSEQPVLLRALPGLLRLPRRDGLRSRRRHPVRLQLPRRRHSGHDPDAAHLPRGRAGPRAGHPARAARRVRTRQRRWHRLPRVAQRAGRRSGPLPDLALHGPHLVQPRRPAVGLPRPRRRWLRGLLRVDARPRGVRGERAGRADPRPGRLDQAGPAGQADPGRQHRRLLPRRARRRPDRPRS